MSGCPYTPAGHTTMGVGPIGEGPARFDRMRADGHRIVRIEEPERAYWAVLEYELARECLQNPTVFSSAAVTPLNPDPPFKMIPIQLDPPDHTPWRRLLARYFSPTRMAALRPALEAQYQELIADFLAQGGKGDFLQDLALKFPTSVFLDLMGLPKEELPQFLEWEEAMLSPDENGVFDADRQMGATMAIFGYFAQLLAARRAATETRDDLLGEMLTWEINGSPATDEDLLNACLLLFLAGLDTVAMSLSFMMHHLATHPADQQHVREVARSGAELDDVVEELLRFYAVPEIARIVTEETEIAGQVVPAGDMVLFPLASVNRDAGFLPDGDEVDLDRPEVAPHLAFGGGPHRCVGSHLARIEMEVALAEWHKVVPAYGLSAGTDQRAYWGAVHGMATLPLEVQGVS